MMGTLAVLGLVGLLTGGCAHTLGFAGAHPGEVECKGKATLTGSGAMNANVGLGGSALNHFAISFDCGDGAYLKQGRPAAGAPVKP